MPRDKPEMMGFMTYESDKPAKEKSILGRAGDDPRTGLLGLPLRTDEAKERQIVEAREILTCLKSLTGMSYSRMANEAGFAASTVSRFMRADAPRFVIKPATLLAIVERAVDMALEELGFADTPAVTQLAPDDPIPAGWSLRQKNTVELLRLRQRALEIEDSRVVTVSSKASLTDSAVRVFGAVEAGVFREAFEIPLEDQETLPIGAERYGPGAFALEVRGDSMDKRFPPGTLLICRPFDTESERLPDNKFVIAMRRDSTTDQVEATVKRLVRTASSGSYVLIPESYNPVHAPLPLEDLGEFSVYISAVVVAAVTAV